MTSIPKLNPSKTALLLLDFQPSVYARFAPEQSGTLTSHVSSLLSTARESEFFITFVRVALTPEELEATALPSNKNFGIQPFAANPAFRERLLVGYPATEIIAELAPKDGELSVRKTRFEAFMQDSGHEILKAWKERGIDQVVTAGIITSGAVLTAVRQLADLDFGIYVVEDCCTDGDLELHKVLMESVFPKQGVVIKETDVKDLLA